MYVYIYIYVYSNIVDIFRLYPNVSASLMVTNIFQCNHPWRTLGVPVVDAAKASASPTNIAMKKPPLVDDLPKTHVEKKRFSYGYGSKPCTPGEHQNSR